MTMDEERFFVTGALGCIGAWVVRNLVRQGVATTVFDLADDPQRMKLIMSDSELAQVYFITGDITDLAAVSRAVQESGATRLIHLAALQVPFCKADPPLGAQVNVAGTINVFEAAKRAGLKQVVYASSIAVYGPVTDYPAGPLAHDAPLKPRTHYGVYKQANEGAARIYYWDEGISSIGLRPYTIYGPGRDQGMTSGTTRAMLAAAAGQPYHIPHGGRCTYQYASDAAHAFIAAARHPFDGAEVFNLPGSVAHISEVIAAIEAVEPAAQGKLTFANTPLPFPEESDDAPFKALLGETPYTPLEQGVAETIGLFKSALADGRLAL